jgi:CelD/BcsL family acetyltransferase involved in cellulose biosynthesis
MSVEVRRLPLADASSELVAAWAALEARAVEPNAFLSPHFVLPATRHLDPTLRPELVIVEGETGSGSTLLALGVFTAARASHLCLLPHVVGYCSRHSYCGGLLVDRDHVRDAVEALFSGALGCHALVLPKLQIDGPVALAMEAAARRRRMRTMRVAEKERAILVPRQAGREALRRALGKRMSDLDRCRRRLADHGEITWHCLRAHVSDGPADTFLRLEHQGWKAESKTSLRSNAADEAFFNEVVRRFDGDGRALFTELRVGGRPVASTCNFVSAGAGFGFKLGWDPELRKCAPGLLNVSELTRAAPDVCADLAWFDSGSQPESFVDRLWPERRKLGTLLVPLTQVGALGLSAASAARRLVRRVRPLRRPTESTSPRQVREPG